MVTTASRTRPHSLSIGPDRRRLAPGRMVMLLLIAAVYIGFGTLHLAAPERLLPVLPPGVPSPIEVILFAGACEVAGGLGLLIPQARKAAAIVLAIYALCAWPLAAWQAMSGVQVPPAPDNWWYHGPRLALQPVIAWAPLFAAGALDWPFRARS